MTAIVFDTLKLSEEFKTAGFDEHKARVLAEKFGTLGNEHLVSREYLDYKLREMQLRMTVNLGAWIAGIIAFFKVMDKFI
jgi:hypothetical protein